MICTTGANAAGGALDAASLQRLLGTVLQQGQQGLIVLPSPDAVDVLVGEIRRQGGRLLSVTPHKASLEDLFFHEATLETSRVPAHMTSGRAS